MNAHNPGTRLYGASGEFVSATKNTGAYVPVFVLYDVIQRFSPVAWLSAAALSVMTFRW